MFKNKETSIKNDKNNEGNWGTFYQLDYLPEERWDPFSTVIRENGMKIGHQTIISTFRGKRPYEFSIHSSKKSQTKVNECKDSFCQLISSKIPSIVISKDLRITKDLFSKEPEFENLSQTTVFTSLNLYSPFIRILLNQDKSKSGKNRYAHGISLIHAFSKHYEKIENVLEKEMVLYLENIVLTINTCIKNLKENKSRDFNIYHFYNIGSSSGASIPHLHSQTLIQFEKKGHGWRFEGFLEAYKQNQDSSLDKSYCLACNLSKNLDTDHLGQKLSVEDRIIWEDNYWLTFVAFAPEKDCQLRLIPKRHVSVIWQLNEEEIGSLAKALIAVNKVLTQFIHKRGNDLFLLQDRNLIFRQHFEKFHMLIDIIPIQQVGGGEILDNYKLSHVFPEKIAQEMKELMN